MISASGQPALKAWLALRPQVLLGRWQLSLVAVKVLKEECMREVCSDELAGLRREAEMLQALNHPNILRFYGACFTCKPVRLVLTSSMLPMKLQVMPHPTWRLNGI